MTQSYAPAAAELYNRLDCMKVFFGVLLKGTKILITLICLCILSSCGPDKQEEEARNKEEFESNVEKFQINDKYIEPWSLADSSSRITQTQLDEYIVEKNYRDLTTNKIRLSASVQDSTRKLRWKISYEGDDFSMSDDSDNSSKVGNSIEYTIPYPGIYKIFLYIDDTLRVIKVARISGPVAASDNSSARVVVDNSLEKKETQLQADKEKKDALKAEAIRRSNEQAAERAEAKRVAKEKTVTNKPMPSRVKEEKVAQDTEAKRIARERAAAQKSETNRIAKENATAQKTEKDRIAKENAAKKAETDRIAKEKALAKKVETDRLAKEKTVANKLETDRIAKEKAAQKTESDRIIKENAAQKAEADRIAKTNVASKTTKPTASAALLHEDVLEGPSIAEPCKSAKWVETAKVAIRPSQDAELVGCFVYAENSGKINIELYKGSTLIKKLTSRTVNSGKSQIALSSLDYTLQSGVTYELRIRALSGLKLADLAPCKVSGDGKILGLTYSTGVGIFNLKFNY